jgi:hypothetical protein
MQVLMGSGFKPVNTPGAKADTRRFLPRTIFALCLCLATGLAGRAEGAIPTHRVPAMLATF